MRIENDQDKTVLTRTPGPDSQFTEKSTGPNTKDNFTRDFDGANTYTTHYADGSVKTEVNSLRRLDEKTLIAVAEKLHDSIHRRGYIMSDPDHKTILSTLASLSHGDREALKEIYRAKYNPTGRSDFLKADLANYLGSQSTEFRQAESFLNRRDNQSNDAGALMIALSKMKNDPMAANAELRNILSNLNAEQIKQLSKQFRADYEMDFDYTIATTEGIDRQTMEVMPQLQKGIDKLDANDRIKMAQIAVHYKDLRLFCESIRGDSLSAKTARQQLQNSEHFTKQLSMVFPPQDRQAQYASFLELGSLGNIDSLAKDYLRDGRISLDTLLRANTGNNPLWDWALGNTDNLKLACRNASDKERGDFALGQSLARSNTQPANDSEAEALSYYTRIHQAFEKKFGKREASIYEDQILHGRNTFISAMAECHRDGPGSLGGHYTTDLMDNIENLSKEDWLLSKSNPQLRKQLEMSLAAYASKSEQQRILALFDAKVAASSYAESQHIHRSLNDVMQDSIEGGPSPALYGVKSQAFIANLLDLNSQDLQAYKNDSAWRAKVDQYIEKNFRSENKVLAKRLLAQCLTSGQAPKLNNSIDNLLYDRVMGADYSKLLVDAEEVLKDPNLRHRLSMSLADTVPLTEQETVIKRIIVDALRNGCLKDVNPLEGSWAEAKAGRTESMRHPEIDRLTESLFKNGKLSLRKSYCKF